LRNRTPSRRRFVDKFDACFLEAGPCGMLINIIIATVATDPAVALKSRA
jgi:hypothetical protein